MHYSLLLVLVLIISTSASLFHPASVDTSTSPSSFVLTACAGARYPSLCVRTLAPASPRTPTELAIAAISASLTSLHSTVSSLRHLPSPAPRPPLSDCLQQLSDSAEQLSKTKSELAALKSDNDRMRIDDACTWVSAALTNEDTCLDGMKGMDDEDVKALVSRRVRGVERLTSNALYFVAALAQN